MVDIELLNFIFAKEESPPSSPCDPRQFSIPASDLNQPFFTDRTKTWRRRMKAEAKEACEKLIDTIVEKRFTGSLQRIFENQKMAEYIRGTGKSKRLNDRYIDENREPDEYFVLKYGPKIIEQGYSAFAVFFFNLDERCSFLNKNTLSEAMTDPDAMQNLLIKVETHSKRKVLHLQGGDYSSLDILLQHVFNPLKWFDLHNFRKFAWIFSLIKAFGTLDGDDLKATFQNVFGVSEIEDCWLFALENIENFHRIHIAMFPDKNTTTCALWRIKATEFYMGSSAPFIWWRDRLDIPSAPSRKSRGGKNIKKKAFSRVCRGTETLFEGENPYLLSKAYSFF